MKKLRFRITLLLVSAALFSTSALANWVLRDTSFNGTGYNLQSVVPPPENSFARTLAIQPDGKILIAGDTSPGDPRKFGIMRFNTDGTLDASFGTGGIVATTINSVGQAQKLLVQPDGKILVAGYSAVNNFDYTIVRYTANGALDATFNSTGYATMSFSNSSWDEAQDMALQPDGKIVLVGRTAQLGSSSLIWNMGIIRLNADGTLDSTFNGTGMVSIGGPNTDEQAFTVIVQADGKILVGGLQKITDRSEFLLVRINSDGTTDTAFGNGGMTTTPIDFNGNTITAMALQSDGKILAGGTGYIARYTTGGVLDASFGTNGLQPATFEIYDIRVISRDRFLVLGKPDMQRFLKDGERDTNFGANILIPNYFCFPGELGVQTDGKIVVGGFCSNNSTNLNTFAVHRFYETPTKRYLDFDGDNLTNMSVFRPSTAQWLSLNRFADQTSVAQFGTGTDRPIPADFTGDGIADIAVFRPSTGEWFILRSQKGTYYSFPFGAPGDVPVAEDFDGDQIADPGVFRPSTGEWFILKSTGGMILTQFGTAGDKPVASDFDGDFKADLAIYRPSVGEWWVRKSSDSSVYAFQFGTATDKPVPGDYTGDNKTDPAFWRPSTGEWFIVRSEDSSYYSIPFGLSDDLPTPGDYTGDGKFDLAVYRPSTNRWHVQPTGGAYFYRDFGMAGDQPIPNFFVP